LRDTAMSRRNWSRNGAVLSSAAWSHTRVSATPRALLPRRRAASSKRLMLCVVKVAAALRLRALRVAGREMRGEGRGAGSRAEKWHSASSTAARTHVKMCNSNGKICVICMQPLYEGRESLLRVRLDESLQDPAIQTPISTLRRCMERKKRDQARWT